LPRVAWAEGSILGAARRRSPLAPLGTHLDCGERHGATRRQAKARAAGLRQQGSTMKLVTAIIKPFKLEEVRSAVSELGLQG
jgi:hypothetical protein